MAVEGVQAGVEAAGIWRLQIWRCFGRDVHIEDILWRGLLQFVFTLSRRFCLKAQTFWDAERYDVDARSMLS